MRVIIAGGRDFDNYDLLEEKVDKILVGRKDVEIVSGKQVTIKNGKKYGADYLGEQYAKKRGLPVKDFSAAWKLHGKKAGVLRNKEMAMYGDALILFWNGVSKGSANMLKEAEERNLKIRVIKY